VQIAETDNSSAKTWGGKTTSDDPTHFLNGGVAQLVAVLAGLQQNHQVGPQAANEGVDPQCDGQLGGIHRVQVAHQKKGDHRNAATKHLLK